MALEPGGLLSIEMPDPESSLARIMGRWWGPYLQPQHLNMVPMPNLEAMLAERGFTVIDRHRAEAHQACDFGFAAFMVANRLGPPVDVPWRPPPTRWSRARRSVGFGLGHADHRRRPGGRPPDGATRARVAGVERLPAARPASAVTARAQPAPETRAIGTTKPAATCRNASSSTSASGSVRPRSCHTDRAALSAPLAAVTTSVG